MLQRKSGRFALKMYHPHAASKIDGRVVELPEIASMWLKIAMKNFCCKFSADVHQLSVLPYKLSYLYCAKRTSESLPMMGVYGKLHGQA